MAVVVAAVMMADEGTVLLAANEPLLDPPILCIAQWICRIIILVRHAKRNMAYLNYDCEGRAIGELLMHISWYAGTYISLDIS